MKYKSTCRRCGIKLNLLNLPLWARIWENPVKPLCRNCRKKQKEYEKSENIRLQNTKWM